MSLFLSILIVCLLGIVVYQDFKNREISWFLIPLLFTGFIINALQTMDVFELLTSSIINLCIVFINLIGVTLIISVKEKKMVNIIDHYLGLGDILFFLVLTVVFSPLNFVFFFLGSILITTVIYGGILLLNRSKKILVPLAGAISFLLIISLFIEHFSSTIQFHQDILLIGG